MLLKFTKKYIVIDEAKVCLNINHNIHVYDFLLTIDAMQITRAAECPQIQ